VSAARDRLALKKRRRFDFPVEITDPGDLPRRVDDARQRLLLHSAIGKEGSDRDRFEADLADLEKELAGHYEPVEFQAAPPVDYEALAATHFKDKGDADVDIDAVLPALAAICAVDEDFQDEAYWLEELDPKTTSWSVGERSELYGRLVEINVARPDVRIPKG